MALKISDQSLFAYLLRSPWWYSALIGLTVVVLCLTLLSGQYAVLFTALSLPFFGISAYAAYKQTQRPNQQKILEIAEQARRMSASEIAEKIAEPYTERRFDAEAFPGKAADLILIRGNRTLLLCSKRFKAANTGIEPLKQLVAAGKKANANGYLYVALGEFSKNALQYARDENIELIRAERLAAYFEGQVKIE
jgi:restriction system protein